MEYIAISELWGKRIIEGKNVFSDVPSMFMDSVKQYLITSDHEELITND